jgi:hypothetical protein
MSAGGILADTMANLKYTVSNPEAVMKSPKVQARIAAAKKAAAVKIEEAIKSVGHFAWRRSGSDDTKKINYEVKPGETSFIVKLDIYPAYVEEFEPIKAYKIFYNDFRGEGYVYLGGDKKNPYLVVQTPTSSKEEADRWLEKIFGSDLVFNPDRAFKENIRYTKR